MMNADDIKLSRIVIISMASMHFLYTD